MSYITLLLCAALKPCFTVHNARVSVFVLVSVVMCVLASVVACVLAHVHMCTVCDGCQVSLCVQVGWLLAFVCSPLS